MDGRWEVKGLACNFKFQITKSVSRMVKVEYTSTDQSVRVFDNQVQVDAMHTKSALFRYCSENSSWGLSCSPAFSSVAELRSINEVLFGPYSVLCKFF